MSDGNRELLITHAQFASALREAAGMDAGTLRTSSGGKAPRSYFVRVNGRLLSLKAVTRLAYIRAGQKWNDLQSELVFRKLRNRFDVVHITIKTERERLERQRQTAERWARPEQARFRERLLEFYGGSCAVSGCSVLDAVDAAHIIGVDGAGEDIDSNGLILRADLHRLFDRDLMAVDPATGIVHFHPICGASYQLLIGTRVNLPQEGPQLAHFAERWQRFTRRVAG
ncbi:HNH endonuclease signature motif containing protein [Novosphingobium sp.]|uniref:HNH endonuclease n=1 Tax=Novosphingobium sp. TaxID=1874826 RepID=UPI0025D9E37A|nr:HNH endonuclease signature motif containing protein [Novosphingobium sp.]MCC6926512.1 HNH endonuclease [Novosphingobium sp.]